MYLIERLMIIMLFLLIPKSAYCQDISQIDIQVDSLRTIRAKLEKALDQINLKISNFESIKLRLELEEDKKNGTIATLKMKGRLKDSARLFAKTLMKIPKDKEVLVFEYSNGYFKSKVDSVYGYIYEMFFNIDSKLQQLIDSGEKRDRERHRKALQTLTTKKAEVESKRFWVKSFTANVREGPSTNSTVIDKLERGSIIFIQERIEDWYRVIYDGPINLENLKHQSLDEFVAEYESGWIHRSVVTDVQTDRLSYSEKIRIKNNRRRENFISNNPNIAASFKTAILNGKIMLGMTKEMVIASWDEPKGINRSVYAFGVHEQWIYTDTYLYFEDGILTSWQD